LSNHNKKHKQKEEKEDNPNQAEWVPIAPLTKPEPFTADWFAYNFLKEWTSHDLAYAIQKDIQIDLSAIISMAEDIIVQQVLNWFKTYRPDLFSVLSSEEGVKWIKMNIRRGLTRN